MLRARPSFSTLSLLSALALVVGLVAVAHPADAAAKRPTVTIKASSTTVTIPSAATLTGTVSGTSPGTRVRLQQRSGGAWTSIRSTRVKKDRTYRFDVTIRDEKSRFRVKVVKNKRLRSAVSRTVTVTGTRTADDAARSVILQKTNEFRAQNGKAPLKPMPELDAIAQEWSVHMATTGVFAHRPSFTASYPSGWTNAGENIAAGQSVETVVAAWIESPGHRANLLGDFSHLGIGYATGGPYGRYYTQNFAKYPSR